MKKLLLLLLSCVFLKFSVGAQKISIDELKSYIGKKDTITVCGKVYSSRFLQNSKNSPTLLNVNGNFPYQKLTAVIFGEDRPNFPPNPEKYFVNSQVCFSGVVIEYNGKPEIVLKRANQVEIQPQTINPNVKLVERTFAPDRPLVKQKDRVKEPVVQIVEKPKQPEVKAKTNSIVTTSKIELRSGPSLDFPVVTIIPVGSTVNITFSNSGWSQVKVISNDNKQWKGYLQNSGIEK